MKLRNKLFTMLLACIMLVAMAVPAFASGATGSGSITIQNSVKDKTYELYKIFDLTYSGTGTETDTKKVAYTIDSEWTEFFTENGKGVSYLVKENSGYLNPISVDGTTKYINITEDNVSDFAKAALSYAAAKDADETITGTGQDETATGLALGYYLIYPQGAGNAKEETGSICSLTSTTPDANVTIKADYPTITKEVDDNNAEIGQKITYTITGKVPDTTGYDTYTYKVQDTMSAGLTFNQDVKLEINGNEITTASPDYTASNGFTLNIDVMKQQANVGKDIVITYTATVNENAVVGNAGNPNKAELTYSNDPSNSSKTTTNPPVEVEVYTAKLVIDKVDGNVDTKLAGAKFVLKKGTGETAKYYKYDENTNMVSWVDTAQATPVTTGADGAAVFNGLENGTYYLEETEAPEGYNKLTDDVKVEIAYNDDTTSAGISTTIANYSGTALPSTGGMGTTIFYILGGVLVVGAGVLLITRRRINAEK